MRASRFCQAFQLTHHDQFRFLMRQQDSRKDTGLTLNALISIAFRHVLGLVSREE
jgi:hypothetical protein